MILTRRIRIAFLFFTSVLLFSLSARSLVFAQADNTPSLDDLTFLEGSWEGTFRGERSYEKHWSGNRGDSMMGMLRFLNDEEEVMLFELLTIEYTDEDELELRVKHFRPGLTALEEKEESDRYLLIESGENLAVFEHLENGSRLSMEGDTPDVHLVRRGVQENGQWTWTDLFTGRRSR